MKQISIIIKKEFNNKILLSKLVIPKLGLWQLGCLRRTQLISISRQEGKNPPNIKGCLPKLSFDHR